ncbi:AAA family ATPase, partial [Candidatus Fermentibacteria bacterium]|nr:AAA family ATPase [Candidatus Fermentibacteria bacterium]
VKRRLPRKFVDPSRGLGRDLPLVGRRKEMELLREDIEKTAPGTVRRVLVSGEPGIGKSRLLREIGRQLPDGAVMVRVRAYPESAGSPFRLVRDILLGAAGITQDQAPAIALERLGSAAMGRLGDRELREALCLAGLDSLPGLECGSGGSPGLRIEFLRRVVASLAPPGRTSVMMFEDIHWADEPSLEVLLGLTVPWAETGLLMLLTARPWLDERIPGLSSSSFDRRLDLQPLSQDEADRMAEMLAGQSVLPGELSAVTARAGGNPFFIEEMVGAVSEAASRGEVFRMDAQGTPVTLRGVLQARIDRIEQSRLRVLGMGSVMGELFWDSAVAAMTGVPVEDVGASLEKLCSEGLLTRSPVSSFSSAGEYRFRHAILRDAVYESVRLIDRRKAHSAAAAWLEKTVGRSLPAFAGVIAHHHEVARENGRAAAMYATAGEEALSRSAYREGLSFFRKGRILALEEKEALRARLALGEGYCLEKLAMYRESFAVLEECLALAESAGDLVIASRCTGTMSWIKELTGDLENNRILAERALELARRSGDRLTVARALSRMIQHGGDAPFEERMKPGLEAREIFRETGDVAGEALCLLNLGNAALEEKLMEQAGVFYRSSLALYRMLGHTWGIANCIANLGLVSLRTGDAEKALPMFGESLALSESIGDREGIVLCHINIAKAMLELDRRRKALEHFTLASAEGLEIGLLPLVAFALVEMADIHVETGKPVRAARIAASVASASAAGSEARKEAERVLEKAMASGAGNDVENAVKSGRQADLAETAARETEGVTPPGRAAGLGGPRQESQPNL